MQYTFHWQTFLIYKLKKTILTMIFDNARRTGCGRGPGSCTLSRGVLVGEGVDLGVTECPQLGLGAGALTPH